MNEIKSEKQDYIFEELELEDGTYMFFVEEGTLHIQWDCVYNGTVIFKLDGGQIERDVYPRRQRHLRGLSNG